MTLHTSARPARASGAVALLTAFLCAAAPGRAQTSVASPAAPLVTIGGDADDRARLAQLRGGAATDAYLLRSASSRSDTLGSAAGDTLRIGGVLPELLVTSNSNLPFTLNDGALWAGRGLNVSVTGGVRARWGPLRVVVAPTYVYSANRDFALPSDPRAAPSVPEGRSEFSYPWRAFGSSIDLPLRFGAEPYRRLDLGQSAVYLAQGPAEYGVANENEWWGPGIRNAIVLSSNAPGFFHVFARTRRPLRTRLGGVEARYLLGTLAESPFFQASGVPGPSRSISAVAATLRPRFEPNVTLGATRAVVRTTGNWIGSAFDIFRNTGRPNARARPDLEQRPGSDQLYSLFARWVLPDHGFESYAEWARTEVPKNVRDFLVAPNHTQGFTLGLQYAHPLRRATLARVQAEYTSVEQGPTFRDRTMGSYYTSRSVLQGYTQRGQVLGAAIGPGSSSQWLASDVVAPAWSAGLFAGRIRWDNDAYLTVSRDGFGNGWCKHDVSLFGGVRGSLRRRVGSVTGSAGLANRLNVFFQNFGVCPENDDRVDERNVTLSLSVTPGGRR